MEIEKWQSKKFEDIKQIDEFGNEYWLARELQSVLGYAQWRRFCDAIDRAMVSCKLNGQDTEYHFVETTKSIEMPTGVRVKWQTDGMHDMGFADIGKTHKKEVRGAIKRIGGIMPEDLPTPEKSILQVQKEQIKTIKGKNKKTD